MQWGFRVISESDKQIARCSINQNRFTLEMTVFRLKLNEQGKVKRGTLHLN